LSQIATLPGQASARDILTQIEATARAARVSEVAYDIRLDLAGGQSTYRGDVTVRFVASGGEALFLDFRGKTIELLEVNGERLEADWNGYRLTLPGHAVSDQMTLHIEYTNDYDVTGDGFHRFVDPEDGQEYVYTNFEPYEAHRLYPCFDQPDIKATYRFTVTAPADWEVIANSPMAEITDAGDGRRTHRFDQTEVFSTYLTALVCGPYVVRRRTHGSLDLGLYSRRSMEKYLDEQAQEILEITGQGMDFYAQLFDQPYPFSKYDQIFVPEYNSGAMENVGCVTYNEAYLFRDKATDNERLDRAETFLHELAHMWFGNLVTMRWWDDLWLNESFATYISYVAMTEATRFTNAWKVFNSDIKRWAYQQDQLPTTHPISGRAADTEIAFLIFDGITYGKGASVLKQLVKYVGRDTFRDGLRLYFRRHAWSNATLSDFLRCLEEAGDISLTEWARLWLQTASVNTISARWQVVDGSIKSMTLDQMASEQFPTLRPHALEIGFGSEIDGRLKVTASVPASIDGPRTDIANVAGMPEPDVLFPNYGDHAYAKVDLDPRSVEYARNALDRVEDDLLRNLLWASLWEMVRDSKLKSTDYLAICRTQLPMERDQDIIQVVLERVAMTLIRYVPESSRLDEAHEWFELALKTLAAAPDEDTQVAWARSAIRAASNPQDVARLVAIVDGSESLNGFEFDQEMRWSISVKSIAYGLPEGDRLLAEQQRSDPSDRGRRASLQAEAARPTRESKQRTWDRINGDGYGSFHLTRAAMMGFFWAHQEDVLSPFVDRFFGQVRDIFESHDHPFARAYILSLYPSYRADPDVLARSHALLAELDGTLPTLSRQLTEHADELERQIRVRSFAEQD
jgi:aminopeptidase N